MINPKSTESVNRILVKSGIVLTFIGLLTFIVLYYSLRSLIVFNQNEEVLSVTELITQAIESSNGYAASLERSMELRLFSISKAIGEELSGRQAETITREELVNLRRKWDVHDISLFVKKDDDIIVANSSDPNEIGISSKEWGYWHEAFQQLFDNQKVDIEEGYSIENYWVGPVSTSAVYGIPFKYAYYYDGSTDFIINPYVKSSELVMLAADSGPSRLIEKMVSTSKVITEIAVINIPPFLEEILVVEPDKHKAILYGSHTYELNEDREMMNQALILPVETSISFERNGNKYKKMYVSIPQDRMLTIVLDVSEMNLFTNKVLLNMVIIFILALLTMLFFAKQINKKALWMLERIRQHAYYDSLTKLPNRNHFMETLRGSIKNGNSKLAVFMLDLDNFKNVNDTLGHAAGDQILKNVAERINSELDDKSFKARMGGDEFTVILPIVNREEAEQAANRLINCLNSPLVVQGHEFMLSMCIGMSIYPQDGTDANTLLKHADMALYHVKNNEKNNYLFFSKEIEADALQKIQLQKDIKSSIENEDFVLYYQPQIDLKTMDVIGIEALIRWNHPTMGMIMPNDFIPHAEESGLIIPLGEWIIKEAFRQYEELHQDGMTPIRLSINLSARQFKYNNLYEQIKAMLLNTKIDPKKLTFEITESTSMIDINYSVDMISQLQNAGIKIAIDDFGTAYSSLSYLHRFSADIIKIDSTFVRNLFVDKNTEVVVKSIIDLANSLGIKVIAEGIETLEQMQFLAEHGCHEMQGYYVSRPIPFEDIQKFVTKNNLR